MASKPHTADGPSTSHCTPQISPSDRLLSSTITLPPNPSIVYSVFIPSVNSTSRPYDSIELARRSILSRNASAALLDSLLASVQISKESCIYVFTIIASDRIGEGMSILKDLHFDGLIGECINMFFNVHLSRQCFNGALGESYKPRNASAFFPFSTSRVTLTLEPFSLVMSA